MAKYSEEDLDRMSGERQSLPRPKLEVPELRFKGKEGKFITSVRPDNWQKGDKYIETELGQSVELVILRVKKFLSRDDFISDEYDSKKEMVDLKETGVDSSGRWSIKLVETDTPENLKAKHALKANAMVYVMYKGELMKLKVGGTSLFSDKYPNALLLYNYASTYDRSIGERAYKFLTKVEAYGPVQFPKGKTFLMSFSRVAPISEEELDKAGDNLVIIDKYYSDLKEFKAQFTNQEISSETLIETETYPETNEDLPIIDVNEDQDYEFPKPPEEINVDDIPF